MIALLRRLVLVGLVTGAGYAAWTVWRNRQSTLPAAAPEWPPMPATAPVDEARWVAPVDGTCPPGYPVKVKTASGIHHVPGGRFYDRTVPDRCYADAAAAEADGYRASRS